MPHVTGPSQLDVTPEELDATSEEVVVGVDTHKDLHVAAVLTGLGRRVASQAFPATAAGYRRLTRWARSFGTVSQAGVEGTGSYGAALTRHLRGAGIEVVEVSQPDKSVRRKRGKTDAIDAECAAQAVISSRATAIAKTSDGHAEAIRTLKLARDSAVNARTKAINQLKAILVGAPAQLRESLAGLGRETLIRRCAELAEPNQHATEVDKTVVYTLRLLAGRIRTLQAEASELHQRIRSLVREHAPQLLGCRGIGPDNAAALLIAAGDNPERLAHEGSYAALCGVSPIAASSGKTHRLRLNRGGDRQANAALYRITLSRLRWDQHTRDYLHRRICEGKTRREVIRCIKRYIAREVYRLLRPLTAPRTDPTAT